MLTKYISIIAILIGISKIEAVQRITFEDDTEKWEEHYVNAKNMELKF